jgi:uncharacterized protein
MRIRISGPVAVIDAQSQAPVTDPVRLKMLDGLVYADEKISDYFGGGEVDLDEIGVTGGDLRLVYDNARGSLQVVSEFLSPRKLESHELQSLVEETIGQWSDGIGEGIDDQWEESHRVLIDIDFGDEARPPQVEQFDDGAPAKPPRKTPLHSAAEKGDTAKLQKLIAKGGSLDPRDKHGMTPLHLAILSGHAEAALLLIEHGADVTATTDEGAGAITFACMKKLESVVVALLDRGCDVDFRDGDGATPLMWAANRGSLPLLELLLARGADPNAQAREKGNEGHTPLMYVQATSPEIATWLLNHGADPTIRTQAGETASQIAARNTHQRGWREMVALLKAAEDSHNAR